MSLKEKILLADDQLANINLFAMYLEEFTDHRVVKAFSVADVEKIANDDSVEITMGIFDGRMPKPGDGKRAAEYLKNRRPGVKIGSYTSFEEDAFGDFSLLKGTAMKKVVDLINAQ